MKRRQILAAVALTVATSFAWAAEPPAPVPATRPADPLAGYIRPVEWLKQQPKPKFKDGHTLPPLSRWGWSLDYETRIEFAENWGYCLEFAGGYLNNKVVDRVLGNPEDPEAKIIALAAKDSRKYKLQVLTSRELPDFAKVPTESFVRDEKGDLLPGPDKHRWSKDQPAYEFPTGDPNARVLARKLKDKPQWLITAWAADGKEREVKVTVPELGEATLNACAAGSVYEARHQEGKPVLLQVQD